MRKLTFLFVFFACLILDIHYVNAEKTLDDGIYILNSALNENKVLDVMAAKTINGTNIQLYQLNGSRAQEWKIQYLNNGYYSISSRLDESKCLDIKGGNFVNYTNVQLYDCNGSDAQQFVIKDLENGYFSIVTKVNDLYIDIDKAQVVNGANVQIYQNNNTNAQKFKLTPVINSKKTIEDGTYILSSALDENKALDVEAGKTTNGTNIQLYQRNWNRAQEWNIQYLNNGYYSIKSTLDTNKCLDVKDGFFSNYTNVQLYDCNESDNQQFIIEDLNNEYYSIVTKVNGLYLDIAGAQVVNGTNVQIYQNNNTYAQKFKFAKTIEAKKTINDGIYIINSALDENKALDVEAGKTTNGTNIQLYQLNGSRAQEWKIQYLNNGYYSISSRINESKCLDIKSGAFSNYANVQLFDCNGSDAQKFIIRDFGDGYFGIVTRINKLFLDVAGAKTVNGTNIHLYQNNDTNAQKFKLVEVVNAKKTINDGIYTIHSILNDSKVLDVKGAKTSNGTNIQLYQANESKAQKWNIQFLNNGYYSISSQLDPDKCLTVNDSNFSNYTNILLQDCSNLDSQQFIIEDLNNGQFNIITKINGLYLDIAGAKTTDETNIQIFYNNGTNAQKFKLVEVLEPMQTISNGTYIFHSALDENKVMDVKGANIANGTNIQLYQANESKAQEWNIQYLGNGYYSIVSKLNKKKCLDISNGNFSIYSNVQLYDCNDSNAQKFVIKDLGNGYFSIVTKVNSLYLDISGAKTANETNIQIYYNNGSNAQRFKLTKVENKVIETGIYTIKSNIDKTKVVDAKSGYSFEETNIQLYESNNSNAQKWYVTKLENGYYTIRSGLNSSLYLVSDSNSSGANVKLSSKEALWELEYVSNDSFYIILKDTNLYLNLENGNTSNGSNINILTENKSEAQKFVFGETEINENKPTFSDGNYVIQSKLNHNMVIDVNGGYKTNRTNIQLYTTNNSNAQIWNFTYLNNGYYSIKSSLNHQTVIDLAGGNAIDGGNIQLYKSNSSDAQQWKLIDDGNGHISIMSKKGSVCLDVKNGVMSNSVNIQVSSCSKQDNQKFVLSRNTSKKIYKGMDVSAYQMNIDWQKVSDSNIGFVVIRAGIGDNWTSQDDKKLEANVSGCEKYNIPYALYLYSYAKNIEGSTELNADSESAASEAAHMIRILNTLKSKGYNPSMKTSVYIDMEEDSVQYLGKDTLTKITNKFCSIIESNGYGCGVYANKTWLNHYLDAKSLASKYDIWLAEWSIHSNDYSVAVNSNPTYNTTGYKLWQFASDGRISGISGDVDLDLGYDIFE